MLDNFQCLVTSDSITCYWDKETTCTARREYQIRINGVDYDTTVSTHFSVENLKQDSDYEIEIRTKALSQKDDSEKFTVHTEKRKRRIDITKSPFYAKGDGKTLNTKVLQEAIDSCKDGEIVYIPKGIFVTGALRLHSNMELFLDEGAILQGTAEASDYLPKISSRFEGIERECYSSLLNLGDLDHHSDYNCRNVIIRGNGTIASGGSQLAQSVIEAERKSLDFCQEAAEKNMDTIPERRRPRLINISNCQNVWISGLTLKNGASWNVHMIYSDNIITNDCTFYSENVRNGDGWDPDSSTNCTIFDCTFYTGDDSISIKSGKNPEGNIINRPSENIRIFDCKCFAGHGITMGSEISGGIHDVKIWDCDMSQSVFGIEIKGTPKRGGYVRNVHVRDCCVSRILLHSVAYNDDGIGASSMPAFEKCHFENIDIAAKYRYEGKEHFCQAIEVIGFEEGYQAKEIYFDNIVIHNGRHDTTGIIEMRYCKNVKLNNITCTDDICI